MQKFFFHLNYLADTIEDPEGSECSDLVAARIEARAILRELLAEHLTHDSLFEPVSMSILNSAGDVLDTVTVQDAVSEIMGIARIDEPPPERR